MQLSVRLALWLLNNRRLLVEIVQRGWALKRFGQPEEVASTLFFL